MSLSRLDRVINYRFLNNYSDVYIFQPDLIKLTESQNLEAFRGQLGFN